VSLAAYLDCAATTPLDPAVAALMSRLLTGADSFGNPSSATHHYGDRAREIVATARAQVAAAVGAADADIVWTSGATEANNLALFGITGYYANQGRHIVTSRTEHRAVLDPCRELGRRGWRVTYLTPGEDGGIDPAQVEAALQPDTVLVSIMHVNNEIGVIQDIGAIAALCARHGGARLHVDAAQSVGKIALDCTALGVDALSLSAHKAYGPKGVGALVVPRARGLQLEARQFGGGQERGLRAGTLATHQLAGMGAAFGIAARDLPADAARIAGLRELLWAGVAAVGGVTRNGAAGRSVPQLLNVSFDGVEGESLMAAVAPRLALSSGSACASASAEPSYVLRALGRSDRLAEASLRFGLGRFTTAADIETAIEVVTAAVRRLRRIGGQ
jgi:cysteine desulfurase